MLGDSYAGHLQGLLYALHDQVGVGAMLVETPGRPFPPRPGDAFPATQAIFNHVSSQMATGDVVIAARSYITPDGRIPTEVGGWLDELPRLASTLASRGVLLVVTGPVPNFNFDDIGLCASSLWGHSTCDVERANIAGPVTTIQRQLAALALANDNIRVFNQFDILCPADLTKCSPYQGGQFVYRDKNHLNSQGAASLAPAFIDFMKSADRPL